MSAAAGPTRTKSGVGIVLEGLRPVDGRGRRMPPGVAWAVGRQRSHRDLPPAALRLSLADHLVFPGLVNAHDHLHLNLFPPVTQGTDAEFSLPVADAADWVEGMRRRIERPDHRALRAIPVAQRAWHGAIKNILAGTTTVVHHDPALSVFRARHFPVHVAHRIGWAHSVALAGGYGLDLETAWHMRPLGRPWFIHLAEGRDARAAADLHRLLAVSGPDASLRLVHGLGLTVADRRLAIASGMGLVCCPVSNQRLLGRPGPMRDFAAAGRAALGSDSRLTGGRDLLAELHFAWAAGLATATQLQAMVGVDAARLCGERFRGRLAPGLPADLIVISDDGRPPAEQLCNLQRADLRLVVRGGRPQVADLDFEPIFSATGTPWRPMLLDGRRKLVAARLLVPLDLAGIQEPGLLADC